MLQFPNRVAQEGVYNTGSPPVVDVPSSGDAVPGFKTFAAAATAASWASGDTVGVYVRKDAGNYSVGVATWNPTTEQLTLSDVEDTGGTLLDDDIVTVYAALTHNSFREVTENPPSAEFVVETGTSRSVSTSDAGKVICCTSSSAVAISLDDALPVGFHCVVVQEGTGQVTINRDGSDTVNGGAAGINLTARWKNAYVYQRTEGAWVVLA